MSQSLSSSATPLSAEEHRKKLLDLGLAFQKAACEQGYKGNYISDEEKRRIAIDNGNIPYTDFGSLQPIPVNDFISLQGSCFSKRNFRSLLKSRLDNTTPPLNPYTREVLTESDIKRGGFDPKQLRAYNPTAQLYRNQLFEQLITLVKERDTNGVNNLLNLLLVDVNEIPLAYQSRIAAQDGWYSEEMTPLSLTMLQQEAFLPFYNKFFINFVRHGNKTVVEWFLKNTKQPLTQADINKALINAFYYQKLDIAKILLQDSRADPSKITSVRSDLPQSNLLSIAVIEGNDEAKRLVLEDGRTDDLVLFYRDLRGGNGNSHLQVIAERGAEDALAKFLKDKRISLDNVEHVLNKVNAMQPALPNKEAIVSILQKGVEDRK